MAVTGTSAFDRAELALANALSGDPRAALTSVVAPLDLTPEQKRSIADRLLGHPRSPVHSLVDIATNPFVIAGAVLTTAYPVSHAGRLLQYTERLGGYLRRVGPIARFFGDMHEIYRGTPIPALLGRASREMDLFKGVQSEALGNAIIEFERRSGSRFSRSTGVRIAAYLDGLDDAAHPAWSYLRKKVPGAANALRGSPLAGLQLTDAERQLADRVRGQFERTWFSLYRTPQNRKLAAESLAKAGFEPPSVLRKVARYWPHVERMTPEAVDAAQREWMASISGGTRGLRRTLRGGGERLASRSALQRRNAMIPDPADLLDAGLIDSGTASLLDAALADAVRTGGHPLRRYSLQLLPTYESYMHAQGRTRAWVLPLERNATPIGKLITQESAKLRAAGDVIRANMLDDTYIPAASGKLTLSQTMQAMQFSDSRRKAYDILQQLPLPAPIKGSLSAWLKESPVASHQSVAGKLAGYFYVTTLGAPNVLSPIVNLSQTLTTTIPVLGVKDTMAGMDRVWRGIGIYLRERRAGQSAGIAFDRAFPQFSRMAFDVDPLSREALGTAMDNAYGALGPSASRATHKTKSALMWMFSRTERFNRLVAFEGGSHKALRELAGTTWRNPLTGESHVLRRGDTRLGDAAAEFGNEVARMTQFGGGPLNLPAGIVNWPAPLRQFASFPMRFANFAVNTATTLGAAEKAGFAGRNYGTLGRLMLGSGLLYGAGREFFDADLSQGLLWGALPLPRDAGPFAPLPIVPPAVSILGAAGLAVARGSTEELQGVLPLLIPGGIGLSRLSQVAAPSAAKAFMRPYADYDGALPDGRVPIYSRDDTLIGYQSPVQLWARAVGLGDVTGTREAQVTKYLLRQRDRIRDFRRRYVDAAVANDTRTVDAVQQEFRKAYPGMGDIQLKKSDLRAVQLRREIPRLERLMRQLPEEYRQQFAAVVSTALAGVPAQEFLGVDPMLLGNVRGADAARARPATPRGLSGMSAPPATPLGTTTGSIRQAAVSAGEERRDSGLFGFSTFDSY